MNFLSVRAKEAIKTALAVTIAYGIAMRIGWTNPYWAPYAVAMISLTTAGQTLNKGILRMLGTLAAATCALIFLSWFFQERWGMLGILTLHISICGYMLTGKNGAYAWYVTAYVCLIIIVDAGPGSASAFHISVTRIGENAMGILVYFLISVFLWPRSSRGELEETASKLLATQIELYQHCRNLLTGRKKTGSSDSLMTQEVQLLSKLKQNLNAATTDNYEVREVSLQWHQFLDNSQALMVTMERIRASSPELRKLNLPKFILNLEKLCYEIEMRFTQIECMLARKMPEFKPQTIVLEIDQVELYSLSPFAKAALTVCKKELDNLEQLSRSLFDRVADIRDYAHPRIKYNLRQQSPNRLFIDPERLITTVRLVVTLWVLYFLWIFVNPPGHMIFVQVGLTIAMATTMMPMVPAVALLIPFIGGSFFAGVIYLIIMPQLSGFLQLGTMIFIVFFTFYYIFWKPQQGLALLGVTNTFLLLTSINNEQIYNFSSFANLAAMIILSSVILVACAYIPPSPRPEKVFLRLLNRFFRQSEYQLSCTGSDAEKKTGPGQRWKAMLYGHDLSLLPIKLAAWGTKIDYRAFPDNSQQQVQDLVTALRELGLRIEAVLDAGRRPQAEHIVNELLGDIQLWRSLIEKEFGIWATSPENVTSSVVEMPERLAKRMTILQQHSRKTLELKDQPTLKPDDYENFYRLLGSYRELAESGLKYMKIAGTIDWAHWQEARF